ncbi:MAG: hypothetical protein WC124_13080, partial [Desulfoplanes sp.]
IKLNLSQILHPSRSFVPFAVKKELNSDNLFENYGSETGFGLTLVFFFSFFLNAFLSASHRALTGVIALTFTHTVPHTFAFTVTVPRSLPLRSSSISIWHNTYLLPVGEL